MAHAVYSTGPFATLNGSEHPVHHIQTPVSTISLTQPSILHLSHDLGVLNYF